jgi:hypothetical protein
MKNPFQIAKFAAACLLLLSFFLPMSSCSYDVPLELGLEGPPADAVKISTETRTTILYPREYVEPGEIGAWLNLLAFTWPFLLFFPQWKFSGRRYSLLFTWAGLLLSVFSAFAIYAWADIGKPLLGAYTGGGAAVALFMLYLTELVQIFWKKSHKES